MFSITAATAAVKVRSTQATALLVSSQRMYSPGAAGATGSSQGFGKREQAEEGAYAKRQEQAQLLKLKEQLASSEKEKEELKKKLADAEAKK